MRRVSQVDSGDKEIVIMKTGFPRSRPHRFWCALAGLAFLAVLAAAHGGQSRPFKGTPGGDEFAYYREMTRILMSYRPGIDYNRLHALYRERQPSAPLAGAFQYVLPPARDAAGVPERPQSAISRILVIANAALYADPAAHQVIDRYLLDIRGGYGCGVELLTAQGGRPEEIKSLIQGRYFHEGLDGVVFIGRLPDAWFEIDNDHPQWQGGFGYADWTCDLFFMDLDGAWGDADRDGLYDSHADGAGDRSAEIFVGRIDTTPMGSYGTEVELLRRYMDKNHVYWSGGIPLYHYGLAYIDHDWSDQGAGYFAGLYGPAAFHGLLWPGPPEAPVGKSDYVANRLQLPYYGFTQVWTHADYFAHSFHTGGLCYESEVHARSPRSVGYNLDGCHICDWPAAEGRSFLCGGYVYNDSPTSLAVIGTSKSGGMLRFHSFYRELGRNACLGEAFRRWMNDRILSDEAQSFVISWHYGMTIVGDPLIAFLDVPGLEGPVAAVTPPLNLSVVRQENRTLFFREYLDVLSWQADPASDPAARRGYRIYGLAANNMVRLADVGPTEISYVIRTQDQGASLYAVAALDLSGAESDLAFAAVR